MPPAPVLLAIDTATSLCSVALAVRGAVHERVREVGRGHTEHVLPMIDELLSDQGLTLNDCGAIAFGAGPGSFTGLRIACGIAQGLAFGIGRPVVPVGNLEALAHDAFARCRQAARVLVAQDARMDEVYWAVYARGESRPAEIAAPALASPAHLVDIGMRHDADSIAGNALSVFSSCLASFRGLRTAQAAATARGIAVLGAEAAAAGRTVDAGAATPLYVRDRVAFTIDERRALAAGKA